MIDRCDPQPDPARPRLRRVRILRVRGRGTAVLDLDGSGHVHVRRGPGDEVRFVGVGCPRFLSAEEILLSGGRGRLEVEGLALDIEFRGGQARVSLDGVFEAAPAGAPRLQSTRAGRAAPG